MASITVGPAPNRVLLTPKNSDSYFYTQMGCLDPAEHHGISVRISAPPGTNLLIELTAAESCGDDGAQTASQSSQDLGWTFDGTEKVYDIPFSKFGSLGTSKFTTVLFGGFSRAIVLGPIGSYCGDFHEVAGRPLSEQPIPSTFVPTPAGTAGPLVIDRFGSQESNALGFWHGGDEGMDLTWGSGTLTIKSSDPDLSFYSQLSAGCGDMAEYDGSYLHIAYSGTDAFSIALQQHNSACNEEVQPYPETWDSLEAARYATPTDIYIPMSHFNINRARTIGIAIKGFYKPDPVTITLIEIVPSVPTGFRIPSKLPSGNLIFACTRPNSFAFAIDDGQPDFAQQVLQTVREEDIQVTFFTVGAPLLDQSTNFSNVYNEMISAGHQIALHSYTHPKMEGLRTNAEIDWEYRSDIDAVARTFGGMHTPYFRPPFGTEGARMRQRFAAVSGSPNPYFVQWSVDVEDWLWAETGTPEKQLDAFQRDVDKGGNLVVMHYLYPSTVGYLKEFIRRAKATGKQLMRVDQCMQDPNAPPL
ncbi:glycosyl hydrolase [Aulographum hederae CBS 113979]|uniref:Glycosyl hydrolase n=1 Tax=Aulographum hederae CBS 113979 TaxID=1176131 RepID=A0A6G1GIY3_9PEZI|nr:glycosyl hydrolase [Aulographum hederae CBS 113979]